MKKCRFLLFFMALFFINVLACSAKVCVYNVLEGTSSPLQKIEIEINLPKIQAYQYSKSNNLKESIKFVNQKDFSTHFLTSDSCIPYVFEVHVGSFKYTYYAVNSNSDFTKIMDERKQNGQKVTVFYLQQVDTNTNTNSNSSTNSNPNTNQGSSSSSNKANNLCTLEDETEWIYKGNYNTNKDESVNRGGRRVKCCRMSDGSWGCDEYEPVNQGSSGNGSSNTSSNTGDNSSNNSSGNSSNNSNGNSSNNSSNSNNASEDGGQISNGSAQEITYDPSDDLSKDQLSSPFAICKMKSYRTPMKIVGMALNIVRIFVPILIIAMGIKDLYIAITGSKDDTLKKAIHALVWRVLAGILIFLLPGIVQFVINMVSTWGEDGYQNNFACCTDCALNFNCDNHSQCNE